jgi:hypothetical protein
MVPEISDDAVRELFVKSHRLIYEIRDEGVMHGARRFPAELM